MNEDNTCRSIYKYFSLLFNSTSHNSLTQQLNYLNSLTQQLNYLNSLTQQLNYLNFNNTIISTKEE